MTNETLPKPAPETKPKRSAAPAAPRASGSSGSGMKVAALGLFCFVLSFLGAWAALASGLVDTGETSITEKRQIVSREGEVVADVARQVSPSVVSIVTESQAAMGWRMYTQQGAGTGIIVSGSGYVLTNKHVIEGTSNVDIVLADGTTYEDVEIVGSDPVNDIAFLKINGAKDLQPAKIGDSSSVQVGEKVIAIGNALGQYQTSVTSGIISGLGRPIVAGDQSTGEAEQLSNLLQTDTAINPGNSGGPLVNLSGEVIGINTAVDQDAEGIGFAIPINDAKGLIKGVTENGTLERAFLGVSHISVTSDIAKRFELSVKHGAYIFGDESGTAVSSGSPADKAGLRDGDVIIKIDDKKIDANNPLLSAISVHQPGDNVSITYVRGGKELTTQATLAPYPSR